MEADADRPAERPPLSQVRLPLAEIDDAPQLELWGRLHVAARLLGGGDHDRQAKCMRVRRVSSAEDIHLRRYDSGGYSLHGLVKCGHFSCPSCGPQRARETSSALAVAIARHLDASVWSDVWMLSLSIPHTIDDDLGDLMDRLYRAQALFVQSWEWKCFEKRFQMAGRVRVLDATHGGPNGCHPHFHIALFPTAATIPRGWHATREEARHHGRKRDLKFERADARLVEALVSAAGGGAVPDDTCGLLPVQPLRGCDEVGRIEYLAQLAAAELRALWERCVRATGTPIRDLTAFHDHAVDLSPSEKATTYFVKWGLADEVGSPTSKARSHLRLLDACAAGVDRAGDAFLAFRAACDGKSWVQGLKKVCDRYAVTEEDTRAYLAELRRKRELELERNGTPVTHVRPLELRITPDVYAGALVLGWKLVFEWVDHFAAIDSDDKIVQRELDGLLWKARVTQVAAGPPAPS